MLHNHLRFSLISVILSLLAAIANAWAGFSFAPYFPIQSGNSWTYQVGGTCCATITVLPGTTTINGVATKALQDSDGFTNYFTNDSNGIRLHGQFQPNVFIQGLGTVDLAWTFSPPIKFANAVAEIGQTVNSNGTATATANGVNLGNFSYSASYTVEAFDHVAVPMGAFDVLRLQGTVTIVGGGPVSGTMYLARSIGLVKEVDSNGTTTSTIELTATNVTPNGDFDGDGKADLVWRHTQTGDVAIWLMNGPTVRTNAWINRVADLGWQIVGVGDLDGDGKADLVWRHTQTGDVDVWLMNGPTVRTNTWVGRIADVAWQITEVADVDGDGKADLVWRHTQTGDVDVWLMDGSTVRTNGWINRVADLDWEIQP